MTEILTDTTELQRFDPIQAWAAARKEEFMPLTITGINDTTGYDAVHKARIVMKNKRVEVEKMRKDIKRYYLDKGNEVDAKAREINSLLDPVESYLKEQEDAIDAEKERIKILKDRQESLPARKEKAALLMLQITDAGILEMSDIDFEKMLLDENTKLLAAQAIKQAEKEEQLRKEREAIDAEKLAAETRAKHEAEIETAKKKAAEQAIADEKLRQERLAAQARSDVERQKAELEAAPDKEKLSVYFSALRAVPAPTMKTKKYQDRVSEILKSIS